MAACAVCLQVIARGARFVLEGTEVFHAHCVQASYRSKQRITEQRGLDLERQLNETRRAAARVENEANRLRNESAEARANAIRLEGHLAAARARIELDEERFAARGDELRAARAEAEALRRELTELRPAQQTSQNEDVDATVQRFKMLELD